MRTGDYCTDKVCLKNALQACIGYIETLCAAWSARERNSSMSDYQSRPLLESQTEQIDTTTTTVGQRPQPPDASSVLIAQQNPTLDASPSALATDAENRPPVVSEKNPVQKTGKFTVQRIPSTPLSELPDNGQPDDASTNRVQPTES